MLFHRLQKSWEIGRTSNHCSQGAVNLSPRPSAPADVHLTSGKIPCPDATAHSPSIESSAGKRKRTISDLDALPQSERAITEQKKRLKSEQSPQFDTMKQLWDRPRYAISVLEIPTVAEMLMSRKAAISTLEFDLNTVSIRKSLYSSANLLILEE